MALQIRKVTEAQRSFITPVRGEPVYAYDSNKLYVGDGATPGGVNVIETILVQDFLDADLDSADLIDGTFIYYSDADDKWKIGKPIINTDALSDVTEAEDLQPGFMIVYDSATQKWIIEEQPLRQLNDIREFDIPANATEDLLLEYNDATDKFEAQPIPPVPSIGDLLGVRIGQSEKRGHLFIWDEAENEFVNDYISSGTETNYYANLYDISNLDIIKYNEETNLFEKDTPFLKDVDLIDLFGLIEPQAPDIVIEVTVSEAGTEFVFNGVSAGLPFAANKGSVYVFDLSDPSMIGKTFAISEVLDGTHSLDPPGEILQSERITVAGTPGVDGSLTIDYSSLTGGGPGEPTPPEPLPDVIYYFCVEEPEFGNKIEANPPLVPKPFVMQWDSNINSFNAKRFNYSVGELGNVLLTPDEDGTLTDFQMLSYDEGLNKWTTPIDRVAGVGIGGTLPRSYNQLSSAMWAGGIEGLGSFDFTLEDGQELKSITLKLSELEIDGVEEEFDAFMFDTEEEREEFYSALEEAQTILGPGGILSREAVDAIADERKVKRARLTTNKKTYTRTGKGKAPNSGVSILMDSGPTFGPGWGELAGMMPDFDLSGLSGLGGGGGGGGGNYGDGDAGYLIDEPGLEELTKGIPSPEETAEAFKEAYKEFGTNVKKIIGAVLARRRALKALLPDSMKGGSEGTGGTLEVVAEILDATGRGSENLPPVMLGWRASTNIYGYYYFSYTTRAGSLTYNGRNHYMFVHSKLRRCGCTVSKGNTFKVIFYYDADDSRLMAGTWLRIIEYQFAPDLYKGNLQEIPSVVLRRDIEEWDAGATYVKGARAIYNNQVWECLVQSTSGTPPASGVTPAPTTALGEQIKMFVEIPAFSVKSQLFEGIYQLRVTLGKDSMGGKTHPVFRFGEPGDEADFVYVGANLNTADSISNINEAASPQQIFVDTKLGHRQRANTFNADIGLFMYDINVHSALQHLMVTEFQTFNIEQRLGECNLAADQLQYLPEKTFTLGLGNASGVTQPSTAPGSAPAGVVTYRGILRPYGNQGYFIDGLNIDAATGAASWNIDGNLHSDGSAQPAGYTFMENLPRPTLDSNGTGAAFISNFFTWRRTDYSDFAFFLPKTLGGGKDAFLGDRIKYRNVPNTQTLVVPSCGSPFASPVNQVLGENGPFNLNIQPLNGSNHVFAARYCVKRRGASLTPKTQKVGEKDLGTVLDAEGNVVASNVEQSSAQAGQTWTKDKTVDILETIPGNDLDSGEAGTSTVSLGRLEASKSAICIAVCDETDAYSQTPRDGYFLQKWDEFRAAYPNRPHWLLAPNASDATLCTPFPNSTLTAPLQNIFPSITPYYPISRNQRTSSPLTYNISPSLSLGLPWNQLLKDHGVFLYDVGQVTTRPDLARVDRYTIRYKVRIPDGTDGCRLRFASADGLQIEIYNPITNSYILVGNPSLNAALVYEHLYTAEEVETYFTPQALNDQDKWLEMIVLYKKNPNPNLVDWTSNPGGFAVTIDAISNTVPAPESFLPPGYEAPTATKYTEGIVTRPPNAIGNIVLIWSTAETAVGYHGGIYSIPAEVHLLRIEREYYDVLSWPGGSGWAYTVWGYNEANELIFDYTLPIQMPGSGDGDDPVLWDGPTTPNLRLTSVSFKVPDSSINNQLFEIPIQPVLIPGPRVPFAPPATETSRYAVTRKQRGTAHPRQSGRYRIRTTLGDQVFEENWVYDTGEALFVDFIYWTPTGNWLVAAYSENIWFPVHYIAGYSGAGFAGYKSWGTDPFVRPVASISIIYLPPNDYPDPYIVQDPDPSSSFYYHNMFRTDDYGSIKSDIYSPNVVNHMSVPWNYMADAYFGRPTYGPYIVSRDNGATNNLTDWFALCKLDSVVPGTIVGLFIDRSGSMTQQTVSASYNLFYAKCAENGIKIVEVTNQSEDWILPFIDEI